MNQKQRRLAAYTRRLLGATPALGQETARELPGAQAEAAAGALESAINDRDFRPGQEFALEAIVLPKLRPVAFIRDGSFADLPDSWAHVSVFRDALLPAIRAIGRVEVDNASGPFGGTGWLCGPGLMLTNRHVAEIFTHGVGGASRLRFIPQRTSRLETAHEHPLNQNAGLTYRVLKPLLVHPHWDAALMQVEILGDPAMAPLPLQLCSTPPDPALLAEKQVVVIGYPYWSDHHDPEVIKEVFNGVYGVKRIQPGRLMRYEGIESFSRPVDALLHDASTLGGNSGSAVIDLETQQVIALHFAGSYLVANYAVPMWELARDPRLVDAGLNFLPAPTPPVARTPEDGGPAWLGAWKGREESPAALAAPGQPAVVPAAPEALPGNTTSLLDPGWFERYSDDELRRFYQRNPEQFRSLLAISMPPEEAQNIYDTVLFDASVEGIPERAVDPSLPEIVLMPGILGSHLDRPGWGGHAWLNPLTLPFSNLRTTLALDGNGNDPNSLRPDGYVRSVYGDAARTWRRLGFAVHEFSYDWRVPLARSAQRLKDFLLERRRARRDARFALVCHSMGGLVASIYARDTSDWRDFIEQAIFCGCPLGGSFAIMQILTGEYALVRKLAAVSLATSVEDMQSLGATLPGALEMLPHPALFSRDGVDVEKLYQREHYAAFARPGADWLRAARRIKDDLRTSPVLGRTTLFVAVNHRTDASFVTDAGGLLRNGGHQVRGDGTVPAVSALVEGVTAYAATHAHSDLLKDPVIIQSVPELLRGRRIPVGVVTNAVMNQPLPEALQPSLETMTAKWEIEAIAVRERMRHGIATTEDIRWLLSTE